MRNTETGKPVTMPNDPDRERGMDLERCLVDGVSGAGSPGTGLGAVARLASSWDGFSAPARGTVITAAVHRERNLPRADFHCGAVCLPFPGERVCGDAWRAVATADSATLIVVDGLGHGPLAAEAARAVCDAFQARADAAPAAILEYAHGMARSTRGAAASVARIDNSTRKVTFSGIGNVSGWLWSDAGLHPMLGNHGTLGHAFSRAREETYVLPEGGSVILATDGLKSRWELDRYPGLARCSAATTATLIWRDFARGRDDATVAVLSPARS
jgi:hypothetical protein